MHSWVVVLPAPFGPRMPKMRAHPTSKLALDTASVAPYRFDKPNTATAIRSDASCEAVISEREPSTYHSSSGPEKTVGRATPRRSAPK